MGKLTPRDVCEIRRLCWQTKTSFAELAETYSVSYGSIRMAAKGITFGYLRCEWAKFSGNPKSREGTLEDEVEMMEKRVDCGSYVDIAEDARMTTQQARAILADPSKAASDLFFRRNGYRFSDASELSLGKMTVDDVKRMLEMKMNNCTFKRIGQVTNFSASYIEQVVYGMRSKHKVALASEYMYNEYGYDWKTWGANDGQDSI